MICQNPDILKAALLIKNIIDIIKILVPVILIIQAIIIFVKELISQDDKNNTLSKIFSKLIVGLLIFFIPNLLITTLTYLTSFNEDDISCIFDVNTNSISTVKTQNILKNIEDYEQNPSDLKLQSIKNEIKYIDDAEAKTAFEERLAKINISNNVQEEITVDTSKITEITTPGVTQCYTHIKVSAEPHPIAAEMCHSKLSNQKTNVYPIDEKTGLSLGSWPKNYQSIPKQLTQVKTYAGEFIWPVTPIDSIDGKNEVGRYAGSYNHNGIDFGAIYGTPIYAVADGTLVYSEWGHTGNQGGDETQYSLLIKLDNPTTIEGITIDHAFYTHMSGIIYRCKTNKCNKHVQKGELLGFVGNASGSTTTGGWAPHLHMTLYGQKYANGLTTKQIFNLYNIKAHDYIKAGE